MMCINLNLCVLLIVKKLVSCACMGCAMYECDVTVLSDLIFFFSLHQNRFQPAGLRTGANRKIISLTLKPVRRKPSTWSKPSRE